MNYQNPSPHGHGHGHDDHNLNPPSIQDFIRQTKKECSSYSFDDESETGQITRVGTFSFDYDEIEQSLIPEDTCRRGAEVYEYDKPGPSLSPPLMFEQPQAKASSINEKLAFNSMKKATFEGTKLTDKSYLHQTPSVINKCHQTMGNPSALITMEGTKRPRSETFSSFPTNNKSTTVSKNFDLSSSFSLGQAREFDKIEAGLDETQTLFPESMKPIIQFLLYLEENEHDFDKVKQAFGIVQSCFRTYELSLDPEDCKQDLIGSIFQKFVDAFGTEVATFAVKAEHFRSQPFCNFFPSAETTLDYPGKQELVIAYSMQLQLLLPNGTGAVGPQRFFHHCQEVIDQMDQSHRDELWVSLTAISMLQPAITEVSPVSEE
jgi:hypothetical protein